MNILCLSLSTFDKVGGVQTFNKFFYRALAENKFNYNVISLHDKKSPNKNVHSCNSNYFKFLYLLFKCSNSETIIIWQHVSLTFFLPILLCIKKINKNIVTLYGTEVWGKDMSILKKKCFMKMDYYWCISKFTAKQIITKYSIERKKIKIFPCCIDTSLRTNIEKNPYQVNKFNILSILRLDKSGKLNAVYDMLKVMPKLIKTHKNLHYTIIGDGNYKHKIINDINKSNIKNHISILGYVQNTRPYLEYCDIFTLTSPLEGFGIVYLEAMLYEKPCLASKNCGSEDVVLNERTGYSFGITEFKKLTDIISKIIKNKPKRTELGKKGYEHLMQNFTFSKFKENQKTFLLDILRA